jgi:hypothetical protein
VADPVRKGSGLVAAIVAAGLLVPGMLATQNSPRVTWGVDDLQAGFCVHFLLDPALVGRTPFRPADLVPVSEAVNVDESLRHAAAESAEFAGWIPAALCTYQFAATRRGSRVQRDEGRPQVVAVWRLAARAEGDPVPAEVMASSFDLSKQLSRPGLRVGLVRSASGKVPESTLEQLTTVIDRKTTITWSGVFAPDSTLTTGVGTERWRLRGTEQSVWTAQRSFQPTEALRMVGSVSVAGRTDLARVLQASPIRWVGPLYRGGSGEISFFR